MTGRLAARTFIGGLFIGHGTQKLFGWFERPDREGTEPMTGKIGMHPVDRNAIAADRPGGRADACCGWPRVAPGPGAAAAGRGLTERK